MELLTLCLTSTYFQYNGKHYKQLHGTAMGLTVSVIVAEIVMQAIEEGTLAAYQQTLPIPLLDCLVICSNNELCIAVYRKPTPHPPQ